MDPITKQALTANLSALSETSPILHRRLCWPMETSHLAIADNSEPRYKLHESWLPLRLPADQVSAAVLPTASKILLFGIGFAEYLTSALANGHYEKIVIWERDPALLRFVLMHHDFSDAIQSGRIKFMLGVDLTRKIRALDQHCIHFHPLFEKIYHHERNALRVSGNHRYSAVGLGGLFVDDLATALRNVGYVPWPLDLQRWSEEELRYSLATLNPTFLVTINYLNGTAEFCENLRLEYLCWEIDPHMDMTLRVKSSTNYSHIFTYRKKNVQFYREAGFNKVKFLPLASNTERRCPSRQVFTDNAPPIPVAFVGRSMVPETERFRKHFIHLYTSFKNGRTGAQRECETLLDTILSKQREDGSIFIIPQLFHQFFPGFRDYLARRNEQVDPIKIVSQIAAAQRRLLYIQSLGPYQVHVWGDIGWKSVENYGAHYCGYAGHQHQLNDIYNRAVINIDIGRLYQLDIVTMRVFDVLACGGFLIAEYSDDLANFFRLGVELESYRTIDELRDKIVYYRDHPESAVRIKAKGLTAVRTRHSFHSRLETMLKSIQPPSGNS